MKATVQTLVPLLTPLISDPESIIRQHLATQLLPLSIACMVEGIGPLQDSSASDYLDKPMRKKTYNEQGYKIVTSTIVTHLNTLIMDSDVDVRRAASEALVGLSLQIKRDDIAAIVLPIPLRLAHPKSKKPDGDGLYEELRVTAANLLAELSGSSEIGHVAPSLVRQHIMPCILSLCGDSSFRVRRAAAQALPRVLGGTPLEDAQKKVLPAFEKLSRDDMYRVRKSTGECLVDMSRSMMILASRLDESKREDVKNLRRALLMPIANRLLDDSNKFVRHGMMQFLGPFIASFYPLEEGDRALHATLPGGTGTDVEAAPAVEGSSSGIGAQFFPHASSMVSRLNSSMSSSAAASPTPTPASFNTPSPVLSDMEQLQQRLPPFMRANRMSILTLRTVVAHRETHPPDPEDIKVVKSRLLKHFVGLAKVGTGDENTDAEMKVYCAYSFPAVLLLLGPENWDGMLKECFLTLINPSYGTDVTPENAAVPPLPVKRCLSSSLHTVAHILGSQLAQDDIMPTFNEYFFRDTDDSVRLNVLRNFPWLMSLLPHSMRCEYLSKWYDVVKGEDLLGAHKRSVTNPMLLNWRQRDYVSRSMPDMLSLVDPVNVKKYLWPILQQLLTDSVNQVREDAEWSIPLLLRVYCAENIVNTKDGRSEVSVTNMRWSADACQEVVAWLKHTILGVSPNGPKSTTDKGSMANFSQRQLYCHICASVGLAVRFSDAMEEAKAEVLSLDRSFEDMLRLHGSTREEIGGKGSYSPYQSLTPAERKHLRRFLVYDLLPLALEMKEDRVTNVRLTLMKTLQSMPPDVKDLAAVSAVLQDLEDEVETWESVYASEEVQSPASSAVVARTMVTSVSPTKSPPSFSSEPKPSVKSAIPAEKSPPRKGSMDERSHASSSSKSKKKKRKGSMDEPDRGGESHSLQMV